MGYDPRTVTIGQKQTLATLEEFSGISHFRHHGQKDTPSLIYVPKGMRRKVRKCRTSYYSALDLVAIGEGYLRLRFSMPCWPRRRIKPTRNSEISCGTINKREDLKMR